MASKYGLVMPKKKEEKKVLIKPNSAFADDDDDGTDDLGQAHHQIEVNVKLGKKVQKEWSDALAEDPSIYSYDEVYDDVLSKKKELDPKSNQVRDNETRKPKYIQNIKRKTEQRKIEQELIEERMEAKRRQEEGEAFADKEAFVTSAFKKKMEDLKRMEEKLRQEELEEAKNDVSKKKDLSSFYANLLTHNSALGGENASSVSELREDFDKREEEERKEKEELLKRKRDEREASQAQRKAEYDRIIQQKEAAREEKEKILATEAASKFARRNDEESVSSARERYLARKRAARPTPVAAEDL